MRLGDVPIKLLRDNARHKYLSSDLVFVRSKIISEHIYPCWPPGLPPMYKVAKINITNSIMSYIFSLDFKSDLSRKE